MRYKSVTFAAAFVAAFLLAGCNAKKEDRLSTNVEDCRTTKTCPPIKPKTAILMNGLGVYTKPGMFGPIKDALEKRGWTVTVLNHTDGKRLTYMPRVVIGHSMGANALLKRAQAFKKNPPELIVSIDAGRAPLWWKAPQSKARTVDIHCPYHPIGGQAIDGAAVHHTVCGTDHLYMPYDPNVIKIVINEVEKLQ